MNAVGRFGHASRLARTVLGRAGPDVGLLQALAVAATERGHVGEAVTARRNVAELLSETDRFREARDELDLALALAPDDVELLVDASRVAMEAGEAERAEPRPERRDTRSVGGACPRDDGRARTASGTARHRARAAAAGRRTRRHRRGARPCADPA